MVINMYDEENVDIEEQITNRVLQEEVETEELEEILDNDDENNILNEDDIDDELNIKINKNTFIYEQSLPQKKKKKILFTHKPSNKVFEVTVIGQDKTNSDKFVFNAKEYKSIESDKIRIFKFQDLKNIHYLKNK